MSRRLLSGSAFAVAIALLAAPDAFSQSHSSKKMVLAATLDGAQVVVPNDPDPPSGTASEAVGKSMLEITRKSSGDLWFAFWMHVQGISTAQLDESHGANETAIQVRLGGHEKLGPIVIDVEHFGSLDETTTGFVLRARARLTRLQGEHDVGLDPEQIVGALRADGAYVSVHTLAYPEGEIRGNLRVVRRPFLVPAILEPRPGGAGDRALESWGDIKARYRR